jgi:hypothetical protein
VHTIVSGVLQNKILFLKIKNSLLRIAISFQKTINNYPMIIMVIYMQSLDSNLEEIK